MARHLLWLGFLALCACSSRPHGTPADEARLLRGMGAIHHAIATRNAQAQRYFDQGLALVYAFNFGEAVRSFQRAAALDPNEPMPYWGLALANGPNYNAWTIGANQERAGFDAIQTAVGLAASAPAEEKAYVDALARLFSDAHDPAQDKLARDYAGAMRDLCRRYPDDPDAAALFAASLMDLSPWHLWAIDGKPGTDTGEIVAVLEDGLRRWPEHTGINHFYIHTMEGSAHPERALVSALRMGTLAPGAGHLVHMASHIYLRAGYYAEAVEANRKAIQADREFAAQQPLAPPGFMGYSMHNQMFLAVSAGMDGEFDAAMNAANALQAHPHSQAMEVMAIEVRLRFAKWDDILASAAPVSRNAGSLLFWHFARACAFAGKGNAPDAAKEQAAMEQTFAAIEPGRAFGTFFNDWSTVHNLAADEVSARISQARGDIPAAIAQWRAAVAVEDGMNFDDVPDWYHPARESLGAVLLRNHQPVEAEQTFREDLRRNPRNPRSLFGLSKALEQEGRTLDAGFVRQSFDSVWKGREAPDLASY